MPDTPQDTPAIAQNGTQDAPQPFDPSQYSGNLSCSGSVPTYADPEKARMAVAIKIAREQLRIEAQQQGLPDDPYRRERTAQTRLDIVRAREDYETARQGGDWKAVADIAKIIIGLSDLERELCGTPKVGTLKPAIDKPSSLVDRLRRRPDSG